jgi:hypothetical protein
MPLSLILQKPTSTVIKERVLAQKISQNLSIPSSPIAEYEILIHAIGGAAMDSIT